jgi:hypothetical protein
MSENMEIGRLSKALLRQSRYALKTAPLPKTAKVIESIDSIHRTEYEGRKDDIKIRQDVEWPCFVVMGHVGL